MYTTTLRETIEVKRSIEDCFRYVRDFSTIEQWDPGVYRAVKTTSGPIRIGTEFDLVLSNFGQRTPMRYRLIEIKDNCSLRLLGTAKDIEADDRIQFFATSATVTRIEYEAKLTLHNLPKIVGNLLQPALQRIGVRAVQGLKNALEMPTTALMQSTSTLAHKLLLPAAINFTERGYLSMPNKAHSRYMDGKTVVITGPTGGIGLAAACELSRLGARLVLVGRGKERLEKSAQTIESFAGAKYGIRLIEADLMEGDQLQQAADQILNLEPTIDVLINNAGALFKERAMTSDGVERTLAINLLAPYRLTQALLPRLSESDGRVINVSSGGQYLQSLNIEDLNSEHAVFDGVKAYARAKRGLISLTQSWAKQYPDVSFQSMHPGWAATPGVASSLPAFDRMMKRFLRDARMGADTIVWLASQEHQAGDQSYFWLDRKAQPVDVLPNTSVSPEDAMQLQARLNVFT